ncbi:MAG: hypothetical protein ACTMIS_05775 [Pseudomonas putida]
MTIDKEKLKALAEAARDYSGSDLIEHESRYNALACEVDPVTVLTLLAEIERLSTSRSKKERELEQELETWRHGPFCWTCGDTGDVHDITGEWRGECDCLSAQLINANRERDQLKDENAQLKNHEIELKAENEALRKDAERYRFVRNPIGTSSPLAIWNEGKMPLFSGMADAVVDEFMAKEASHD